MKAECKICNKKGSFEKYTIREMMFGTRDSFDYFQCPYCGCLQLLDIPQDLSKYYPHGDYKAFTNPQKIKQNILILKFKRLLTQLYLWSKSNLLGERLSKKLAYDFIHILSFANISLQSKILDVGAGTGKRLVSLSKKGFLNLTGTDIFIEKDLVYPNGIKIYKKDINDIKDTYDFIMLNHVFEHMPNPLFVLKKLNQLLRSSGYLLIRIPVADSFAWHHYKENWVQIDAPRHLFLHTKKSIELLAGKSDFTIERMIYDSRASQFYGSEQYKKDISMFDAKSYYVNPRHSIFSKKEIKHFESQAQKLNRKNNGDSVCFFLRKDH